MRRSELKARAKAQLGGQIFSNQWMMALALCLISTVITTVAGIVVPGLGALIITGPLTVSLCGSFVAQTRYAREMQIEDLFVAFKRDFGGCFILALMQAIFIFLWSLLFVIPGIVKSYSYAMCMYIKSDHPDYDWRACLDASRQMMKGNKWRLFVLDLSFIGWYIVGALIIGVGTLWVVPYHQATRAQFYEDLVSGYEYGASI